MNRSALIVLLAAFIVGCPDPDPPPPPPPNPPTVTLLVTENNIYGDSVKGTVNVVGCKKVAGVELFHQDERLQTIDYTSGATNWTLPSTTFAGLYSRLGFAASLTLKAKATCDDARTNTSLPVGVKFFPITQKYVGPSGEQLVPDNFVAEGGDNGGSQNTFLGCVRVQTGGTTLARVDRNGTLLAMVDPSAMPFDCSLGTQITDLSTISGFRWIFEPGVGAYALCLSAACGNFSIGKVLRDSTATRIGVSRGGVAVVWLNISGTNNGFVKLFPGGSDTSNDLTVRFETTVILNADPLVDDGAGQAIWMSRWEYNFGAMVKVASIVPYKYDLGNGQLTNGVVNGNPAVLLQQQYPMDSTSMPIMPVGFFSPTGDQFTIPLLSYANDNTLQTTVVSCATAFGLCQGTARRWSSATFPGMIRLVVPYSANNIYAAIGPYQVWFLESQRGTILNLGEKPITPSGSNVVVGVQPGGGADFYVLTGPDLGMDPSFPNEIIAVDTPQAGELWRVGFGSGESPNNGMTIAIDVGNHVWLRTGQDLIQPLTNADYRAARGPTPP
ncbi:MAG: hypothetical protein QM817_07390 [Archangium sp.]